MKCYPFLFHPPYHLRRFCVLLTVVNPSGISPFTSFRAFRSLGEFISPPPPLALFLCSSLPLFEKSRNFMEMPLPRDVCRFCETVGIPLREAIYRRKFRNVKRRRSRRNFGTAVDIEIRSSNLIPTLINFLLLSCLILRFATIKFIFYRNGISFSERYKRDALPLPNFP